tara:strand:+ start:207 stop:458 length:252 start_codon:yes stop_codon:yes gene_type:complete
MSVIEIVRTYEHVIDAGEMETLVENIMVAPDPENLDEDSLKFWIIEDYNYKNKTNIDVDDIDDFSQSHTAMESYFWFKTWEKN